MTRFPDVPLKVRCNASQFEIPTGSGSGSSFDDEFRRFDLETRTTVTVRAQGTFQKLLVGNYLFRRLPGNGEDV